MASQVLRTPPPFILLAPLSTYRPVRPLLSPCTRSRSPKVMRSPKHLRRPGLQHLKVSDCGRRYGPLGICPPCTYSHFVAYKYDSSTVVSLVCAEIQPARPSWRRVERGASSGSMLCLPFIRPPLFALEAFGFSLSLVPRFLLRVPPWEQIFHGPTRHGQASNHLAYLRSQLHLRYASTTPL